MKKITMLLAAFALTALGRAVSAGYSQGCSTGSGSYSSALNSAAVGTASSTLDLSATANVYFRSTGTASTQLGVQWSDTTSFIGPATLLSHDAYCTPKRGRYLRFLGTGSISGRVTVTYFLSNNTTATFIGSADISSFSSTAATAYMDKLTRTATRTADSVEASENYLYTLSNAVSSSTNPSLQSIDASLIYLTQTALPVLRGTSRSAEVWLTQTASVKSLTNTVALPNARCIVCLAPNFGGAGIRVGWGTSYTAPTDLFSIGIPIATSASAQCFGPFYPGINVYVQGSGAASVTGALSVDEVR